MPGRNRRSRRFRFAFPRQVRLAISAGVLALLILCVVLILRGCAGGGDASLDVPAAGTQQQVQDQPSAEQQGQPASGDQATGEQAAQGQLPQEQQTSLDASPEEQPAQEQAAAPQQTAQVLEGEPFGQRSAVIRSIGDIVMHNPLLKGAYNSQDNSYDFSPYFSQIKDSMAAADYTVINVDGPMGGKKHASYRGYPQFNTPPHLLYALVDCGVDMLTLANNHALDTYYDGLKDTIDNVESVGLDHVGAYRTQEEHDTPKVVVIGGIRVGITNYTVGTNNMAKRSDEEATLYGLRMVSNSNAPDDIQALRDAGAEVVIVYMHWGEEYLREVNNSIRNLAKKLVAAGADVVIGGHQHVVLPCEYLTVTDDSGASHTGLVLYGMGNFLSDQRARYRDSGIIFEITLQDNPQTGKVEAVSPRYIPTYVQRTKGTSTYDYRVWPVGAVLDDPPSSISQDVLTRIRQVWQEQQEIFASGPATAAKK